MSLFSSLTLGLFDSPPWDRPTYWALDLETGGLDAKGDLILAVGMVPIREGVLRLGQAYRSLVRPERGGRIDPETVRVHQILWGELQESPPIEEVLPEIEARLRDAVLLVHYAAVDVAFLKRAFRRAGRKWPSPPVVDTAKLLRRIATHVNPELPSDMAPLNLALARRVHGLPVYQAHDALTDAIATGELFLVLRKKLGATRLRDLT